MEQLRAPFKFRRIELKPALKLKKSFRHEADEKRGST